MDNGTMSVVQMLKRIKDSAGAPAKIAKMQLYSSDPVFLKVLEYAYKQRLKFHVKLGMIPKSREVSKTIKDIFPLLDDLATRTLTGSAASSAVMDMAHRLSLEDARLFQKILNKNLDCGIGTTLISKALGAEFLAVHKVMKAYAFDESRVEFPCWASYKLDFLRATLVGGQLLSTTGKPFVGVDHILDQLHGAPGLDGELTIPDMEFNEASGLLRSDNPCPTAEFNMFDVTDHPSNILKERLKVCQQYKNTHVKLIKHKIVNNMVELNEFYYEARNLGYEGVVIKTLVHPHVKKRTYSWMKMKPTMTLDGKITALLPGTGRNEGYISAVTVAHVGPDYRGTFYTDVSNFTDDVRDYITAQGDAMLGRWIEFHGMEYTPDGKVRHPTFERFREDLD